MKNSIVTNGHRKLSDDDIKFIINALRMATIKWPGRALCLRNARKRVLVGKTKDGKKIWKYFWQCAVCEQWFRNEVDMEVDHIIEIGTFSGDWNEFLPRLFATQDNLQCLCTGCHLKKTMKFNSARSRWKRKS